MLTHIEIIHMYLEFFYNSLSRQGEACKEKIRAG